MSAATTRASPAPRTHLRVNWVLPTANMSGGTKSNRLIAEALARRGHRVTLAYPKRARPWPPPWRPRRFWRRLAREVRVAGRQRHHLKTSSVEILPIRSSIVRSTDVPDADITIGTWWETMEWISSWPVSKGRRGYFVRHYEIHGGDPDRVKATYRLPALKLVIATWLQRLMRESFDDPTAVLVPNGVDWNQFSTSARPRAAVPTVGMYFGVPAYKGCATAVAAIQQVQAHIPTLRVVAFGSSPWPSSLPRPKHLTFHLLPPQQDLAAIYASTDVWLVSSVSEGFGMPGLEAAACYCPLVSTRCGGPEDYVEDGVNGYLVPVSEPTAMADALLKALNLPDPEWQAMSRASHAIAKRFNWDASAEVLEQALVAYVGADEAP